jgi:hypothetical protein
MGINMSWIFVDGIDQNAPFAAVDLAPTGELPLEDRYDLGSSHVPLAGVMFDYVFDVPFDVAATITGFRHTREEGWELFTNLQALEPVNGNVLTKLGHPPKWWQTLDSIEYS